MLLYIRNIYQENESFFDYILNLDTAVYRELISKMLRVLHVRCIVDTGIYNVAPEIFYTKFSKFENLLREVSKSFRTTQSFTVLRGNYQFQIVEL